MLTGFLTNGPETADPSSKSTANPVLGKVSYRQIRAVDSELRSTKQRLGKSSEMLLAKINRADVFHLRRRKHLVVPNRSVDVLDCSPFPRIIQEASSWPKLILVSLRVQAFAAYESGELVRWGPTSTGVRRHPTPPTLYYTSWKSRQKASSLNRSWIMPWYVNLHTSMGVAFHQYAMPGRPDSHGCIRLLREDAIWMYRWTDRWIPNADRRTARVHGTPVIVFGEYDYGKPGPWTHLPRNPQAADVGAEEIRSLMEKYAPIIEERSRGREVYFQQPAASKGG